MTAKDRPILTHCQILGGDLLQKMADLGVIANVQPQFVVKSLLLTAISSPLFAAPFAF
jgi:predicted amidohydrolase YtcJ